MPTITPSEFLKDYKVNFKAHGHIEALRILRQRIVSRHGHAWYQQHRRDIERELAGLEHTMEEK